MALHAHRITVVLRLAFAGLAALSLVSGTAWADGWVDNDPAEATSDDMENHEATSGDPDDIEGTSEDPNDLEGASEDPNDLEGGSEKLADHEGHAEDLEDHEGTSYDLSELPVAAPDDGFDPIEMPEQDTWEESFDPDVIVARRNLERAQDRARKAREAYGQMMQANYPRGAGRVRIVDERDAAEKALEEAKAAVRAVGGDDPGEI